MKYWDIGEWILFVSLVMAGLNGTIALFERVKNGIKRCQKEKAEREAELKKYIQFYIDHHGE